MILLLLIFRLETLIFIFLKVSLNLLTKSILLFITDSLSDVKIVNLNIINLVLLIISSTLGVFRRMPSLIKVTGFTLNPSSSNRTELGRMKSHSSWQQTKCCIIIIRYLIKMPNLKISSSKYLFIFHRKEIKNQIILSSPINNNLRIANKTDKISISSHVS